MIQKVPSQTPGVQKESRKHRRFRTNVPVRFKLNPGYHHVSGIRKLGVARTVRNISREGIRIES